VTVEHLRSERQLGGAREYQRVAHPAGQERVEWIDDHQARLVLTDRGGEPVDVLG
jgi:hypothetical protein